MSWQERIEPAEIITPDGTNFNIEYMDLPTTRQERAVVFPFAEFSGDYVSRLSSGGNSHNITVFFSGPNHDITAEDFEEKTKDPRPLVFVHPFKGRLMVQLLSLSRNDSLATGANRTAFNLDLHETINDSLPASAENTAVQIDRIVADSLETTARAFDNNNLNTNGAKFDLGAAIEAVNRAFISVFTVSSDVLSDFEQMRLTAINAVTTIETNASMAAFSVQQLVNYPSKITASLSEKVAFYNAVAGFGAGSDDFGNNNISSADSFQLFQSAAIMGFSRAVVGVDPLEYKSRKDVFKVVDDLFLYLEDYTFYLDSIADFDQNRDTHRATNEAVAFAVGNLDIIALSARQERSITLKKKKDLWVLAYSLYSPRTPGALDEAVETLIEINSIKGEALFELEPGQTIYYYL